MKRLLTRLVIALTATAAVVTGTVTPAHAADANYWSNNPTLCKSGCTTNKGLIKFWQSILWADKQGQEIDVNFVDGEFGQNTHQATWRWQAYIGRTGENGRALSRDGKVGRNTWYAAWRHSYCEYDPSLEESNCVYRGADPGADVIWKITSGGGWLARNPRNWEWYYIS